MRPNMLRPSLAGFPVGREDRSGVAAMEFAIVAPMMALLIWGVWDLSRALVAWEETNHAAEAIAQAAEKLSVTNKTYQGSTQSITELTSQQMQDAMTSIYAEMPWLNLGAGTGSFTGNYGVTLSGVSFTPLCTAGNPPSCAVQTPVVLWSTYLTQAAAGGGQLMKPLPLNPLSLYRACGQLVSVAQFPNNSTQLLYMINPNLVAGGATNIILIPQVVADVQFVFHPTFPLLSGKTFTFVASATFPAPLGGDNQQIVFDATDSNVGNVVENCPNSGAQ